MIEIVLRCDRCTFISTTKAYSIYQGKEPDSSGNGYAGNYIYKEYCHRCLPREQALHPDWKYEERNIRKTLV